MSLILGTRLGPYEVVSALGAGGMGEVYRATDTVLRRQVALKVLPSDLAADPERVARFQREAEVLAALNHPKIAHLYGIEQSNGTLALVMELVEGETLAERIAQGPVPLDEALPIARQIAEALDAAHEQGIIHRDLKPANIKVRPDGTVKVLDFGLAKAMEPAASDAAGAAFANSPTITSPALMTGVGVLLGTVAYMAPEQAKGKPADKRSDIWAFGCVLYEMLTAGRAFPGVDVAEVLAAVIKSEPDWSALPATVDGRTAHLLKECLEKDRSLRLQGIAVVRYMLDDRIRTLGLVTRGPAGVRAQLHLLAGAIALILATAVSTWWATRRPAEPMKQARFAVEPAGKLPLGVPPLRNIAVTPDGTRLVYQTAAGPIGGEMYVRRLDSLETVQLRGLFNPQGVVISPDSGWVLFNAGGGGNTLMKVSVSGGPPAAVCPLPGGQFRGAAWTSDGNIIFASGDSATGLRIVPSAGGEPTILTTPDPRNGEEDHLFPSLLPDGKTVLFTITAASGVGNAQIAALNLTTGERKILIRGGTSAEYVSTGHLVYAAAGTLRAVRFDPTRVEVIGDPEVLVNGLRMDVDGAAQFSISRDGTLVYVPGGIDEGSKRQLVWVSRAGTEQPLGAPSRPYMSLKISPDGTRIALDVRDEQPGIWFWDIERAMMSRLAGTSSVDRDPAWTSNGQRVIFSSRRTEGSGVYWQAANGAGAAELLRLSDTNLTAPSVRSVTPDGRELLSSTPTGLQLIALSGVHETRELLKVAGVFGGELSPDGHWLAYQSPETGRLEVHVRPFQNPTGGHWQVTSGGGTRPMWSSDGHELYFFDLENRLNVVGVHTEARRPSDPAEATFVFDAPRTLLEARYYYSGSVGRTYDVSPTGRGFLMLKVAATEVNPPSASMIVVLGWRDELVAKLPIK